MAHGDVLSMESRIILGMYAPLVSCLVVVRGTIRRGRNMSFAFSRLYYRIYYYLHSPTHGFRASKKKYYYLLSS